MDKPENAAELEMDMDIDTDGERQPHLTACSQHQISLFAKRTTDHKLFIIIDTNILLAHLNIVILLKDQQIAGTRILRYFYVNKSVN